MVWCVLSCTDEVVYFLSMDFFVPVDGRREGGGDRKGERNGWGKGRERGMREK